MSATQIALIGEKRWVWQALFPSYVIAPLRFGILYTTCSGCRAAPLLRGYQTSTRFSLSKYWILSSCPCLRFSGILLFKTDSTGRAPLEKSGEHRKRRHILKIKRKPSASAYFMVEKVRINCFYGKIWQGMSILVSYLFMRKTKADQGLKRRKPDKCSKRFCSMRILQATKICLSSEWYFIFALPRPLPATRKYVFHGSAVCPHNRHLLPTNRVAGQTRPSVAFFAFFQLFGDVFLYSLCVFTHSVRRISLASEFAAPVWKFRIPSLLKYQ